MIRSILAMVAAGLALPRVEILRLVGLLSPAAAGTPDAFGDVLQAALDLSADEPERREDLLVKALGLAAPSAAPDSLFVLRTILQREDRPLQPDTLRACASHLAAMAAAGAGGDTVAWDLGIVSARVNAGSLGPELFGVLAEAGEALIGRDLSEPARLAAGLGAAEQWLRLGRLDRSDAVLYRLRQAIPTLACQLRTAVVAPRPCAPRSTSRHGGRARPTTGNGQPAPRHGPTGRPPRPRVRLVPMVTRARITPPWPWSSGLDRPRHGQSELEAVAHPMAQRIAAQSEALRHSRAFADPARWASYLHWGGAWRAAP